MTPGALEGIKVIDLTHHVAGPYCTKLLADFGAEVIKVERPGIGDPARNSGPFAGDVPEPDRSLPFLYLNTNKRSVTLDIKSDAGQDILKQLVRDSHLLVENFRPGTLLAMGLSYEELRSINPSLVMLSISNFGQTGPYRDYEATDIVEYALGGLMYIFGLNEREPLKHAMNQAQYKTGANAASGAAIAIMHQQLTGQGQQVDVSIQESVASAIRDTTLAYGYTGVVKWRQPKETGEIPRGPVRVSDGYIMPINFGPVDWQATAEFLDAPALLDDKFATPESRVEHAVEFDAVISEAFEKREKFEIFYEAHKQRRLIYGVVHDPKEVVENPQYIWREFFREIDHPIAGTLTYPGAPFTMSETPWKVSSPAPTLGQHNQEIYRDRLGISQSEITRLFTAGVI
ncbi:MAG: CoA transferase [SAR202 cluster bacterium]|nr:CoA transferase [SAR202 cluster bacterium]MDP6511678.1 CoA transferase [SAR202 cluster bacterium]MDP6713464.1 CoA transferase [SAR202 cluster bacterium]